MTQFPNIDLFATRLNHRLPLYVSLTRSKGPINRCSIDELESHSRLRFSSISSHSCIDQQNTSVSVQNSIDSSFLTQQIMVPRTSGSAGVSTNNPPCNSKSIRTITRKVQASKHRYAAASRLGIISNQSEIKIFRTSCRPCLQSS